jgi:hypothetical protein
MREIYEKENRMKRQITAGEALSAVLDWGVFLIASGVCFLKSAEVMTRFAPNQIFGVSGVQDAYGLVAAVLIEGVLIIAKISTAHSESAWAWIYNIGLIVLTWGISAAAQIFDGFLTAGSLAQQPATIRGLVVYGVPVIPSVILLAVMVRSIVKTIPSELTEQAQAVSTIVAGRMQPVFQQVVEPAAAELHRSEDGPAGDAPFSGGEAGDEPDAEVSA